MTDTGIIELNAVNRVEALYCSHYLRLVHHTKPSYAPHHHYQPSLAFGAKLIVVLANTHCFFGVVLLLAAKNDHVSVYSVVNGFVVGEGGAGFGAAPLAA